jgi:hypothetical protein
MSTARNAAIDRAVDTIRHFDTTQDPIRNIAIAVVNTLNPQITDSKQLLGVPEGSILIFESGPNTYRPLTLSSGRLWGRVPGVMDPVDPVDVLKHYGKLTAVWMP